MVIKNLHKNVISYLLVIISALYYFKNVDHKFFSLKRFGSHFYTILFAVNYF